jgi:catechol O-methyltransferase
MGLIRPRAWNCGDAGAAPRYARHVRFPFRVDRSNALPFLAFFGREGLRFAWDRLRGAPPRSRRALDYVRAHAAPGDPESVLTALDRCGREQVFLMNVGDRKGEILDAELRRARPARSLEIGAFCGYSAVRTARLLREWGGCLVSVEADPRAAEVVREMVEFAALAAQVEVQSGKAEQVIPGLSGPFDFVFLDHWKDLYLPDLRRLEQHGCLRRGSVVVADNVALFDVTPYLDYVRSSGRYDSVGHASTVEYMDSLPDAVEVSVFRG